MTTDSLDWKEFWKVVEKEFEFLVDERGFVVSSELMFRSFGNALVEYSSDCCKIKVGLDRGSVYMAIGNASAPTLGGVQILGKGGPTVWYDFVEVVGLVEKWDLSENWFAKIGGSDDSESDPREHAIKTIKCLSQKLDQYLGPIMDMFSEKNFPETKKRLDELMKASRKCHEAELRRRTSAKK